MLELVILASYQMYKRIIFLLGSFGISVID